MKARIRPETVADIVEIQRVNDRAFGSAAEGQLVDALRNGGFVRLSLVAEIERQIVGHILFSELRINTDEETIPALSLAPMAVLPEFQRLGIGSQLVHEGLALCRQHGHRIVIVVGHPQFYPQFGFSAALARPLASPYAGEACMALELTPGALSGVTGRIVYSPPFDDV